MNRKLLLILLTSIIASCNKDKYFGGPDFFEDDFENYTKIEEMLVENDLYWSFTQITKNDNLISIDSAFSEHGEKSLKFFAKRSDSESLSKCSISKQNMAFKEGETVRLSGWYFLEGIESHQWMFLMDLEEQTAIGAGPGMRLALVNDQLRVEYKFNQDDIIQSTNGALLFPRNEWVHLVWEVKLSKKKKGSVKLWQNETLIIDATDKVTLPKDILYFQQGTKGMYSSCEIGVTANSKDNDVTLWVDDVRFEKVN